MFFSVGNEVKMTDYIFPNKIAKFMAGISQRTQYEASMMAMVFILFGLIFFGVYSVFFSDLSTAMKIGIAVNSVAGLVLLGSFLVTTYQQFKNYKEIMGMYKNKPLKDEDYVEIKVKGG